MLLLGRRTVLRHAASQHGRQLVKPYLTLRLPCPQTVAGLGVLLLGGRTVLRRIFAMVANSRSDETFVALCLLTVVGASLMTQALGLSETMGSFVAGVLLAETNYRTQARRGRAEAFCLCLHCLQCLQNFNICRVCVLPCQHKCTSGRVPACPHAGALGEGPACGV